MTFAMANRGLFTLINTAISAATDFRCLVLTPAGTLSAATIQDLNFVSDVLAQAGIAEANNGGYTRQDLVGVACVEDDAGNRVQITATAPVIPNVAAGAVWGRVVYYVEGGGTDATRPLIGVDTPASTLTPNGGNVTLPQLVINVTDISV
jgi:hypothetical protein